MGLWCSVSHMVACSVFYKANVIGDHDTCEVSVTNHYEGKDWLRIQVQNSGNFKTDSPIYIHMYLEVLIIKLSTIYFQICQLLLQSDFANSSAILQGE